MERLKQSLVFGSVTIELNTELSEKESRMYHISVFIHTMFKIARKILMIGRSFYLRNMKHTNNLKKGKLFGNTIENIYLLGLIEKGEYLF